MRARKTVTLLLAFCAVAGFVAVLLAVFAVWSAARLVPAESEVLSLIDGKSIRTARQSDLARFEPRIAADAALRAPAPAASILRVGSGR